MTALSLSAVGGTGRKSSVALSANRLLTVVLGGKSLQRGLNDTTSESSKKVQGRFLGDVVVGESSLSVELSTSKDQSLLGSRDLLGHLDLHHDIFDGVTRLHFVSGS